MNGKALQKRSTIRQTSQAQRVDVCLLGFCPLYSACQARFGTSFPSLGSADSISTLTSSGFCSGVTADSIAYLLAVNPKATESLLPEGTLLGNREPCQTARIPHGHFLQGQTSKYWASASERLICMFSAIFFSWNDNLSPIRPGNRPKQSTVDCVKHPNTEILLEYVVIGHT